MLSTSSPSNPDPLPVPVPRRRKHRRVVVYLAAGLTVLGLLCARPLWHVLSTAWNDVNQLEPVPPGFADDVSRMNRTPIVERVAVAADAAEAERQLAELLARAEREHLPVTMAGARHSMGGHTIAPAGIVIDMLPFQQMQYDAERELLHVQAGARWRDIIPYLDRFGRSVAVMQSDNTFTVGGSLSVNCHGWQYGRPPIAATVESLRLMRANGVIVRCSRTEHAELFSLVLGGYGLFGIILDAELRVVPNERYRLEQFLVPVNRALATFEEQVEQRSDAVMVYARIGIVPDRFLDEVILNVFYREAASDGPMPALTDPELVGLRRSLFRGSVGSDYGKELRWAAEARLQPHLSQRHFSRNQLLNEGSDIFQNRTAATTDILHEYFIPRAQVEPFVVELRQIIPRHRCDLLNITVRGINADTDSFLRYADQRMLAFVMLFNQPRTAEADAQMAALTRELIDAALAAGGRYYLPYRLHATPDQFRQAYPQADRFFELKREYDPQDLFQNQFYRKYRTSP
ncbi:MAG: FAD-binding oxidoreductase [Planctomycetes bacterium]|nr:FAD-binding oxidoreductase [Planctomycetota bacterium]